MAAQRQLPGLAVPDGGEHHDQVVGPQVQEICVEALAGSGSLRLTQSHIGEVTERHILRPSSALA